MYLRGKLALRCVYTEKINKVLCTGASSSSSYTVCMYIYIVRSSSARVKVVELSDLRYRVATIFASVDGIYLHTYALRRKVDLSIYLSLLRELAAVY